MKAIPKSKIPTPFGPHNHGKGWALGGKNRVQRERLQYAFGAMRTKRSPAGRHADETLAARLVDDASYKASAKKGNLLHCSRVRRIRQGRATATAK